MIEKYCRYCLLTLLMAFPSLLAGCSAGSAVGVVTGVAEDNSKMKKAEYVPKQEPMLVLVESYENAGDVSEDAAQLGVALVRTVNAHKIAPVVDPQKVEQLRDQNPQKYQSTHIESLGRAVASKQVLYVDVLRSDVESPESAQASRGDMLASVRIVDSTTGETRWPQFAQYGQLVEFQTPWTRDQTPAQVRTALILQMADHIAKLFYDSNPQDDAH